MTYDPDTAPATWVSAQADRRKWFVWAGLLAPFVAAAFLVALALDGRSSILASAVVLLGGIVLKPRFERFMDEAFRWRRGAQAERAVGEKLDELRRDGWVLMHDLRQRGEGNIDHLAWGPNGVFLVETKERRYLDRHLVKVKRQAAKVHGELGVWVTPVICLHRRDSEPFRTHGVWIVPRRHLLPWLRAQRSRTVPFERLAAFADRVGSSG